MLPAKAPARHRSGRGGGREETRRIRRAINLAGRRVAVLAGTSPGPINRLRRTDFTSQGKRICPWTRSPADGSRRSSRSNPIVCCSWPPCFHGLQVAGGQSVSSASRSRKSGRRRDRRRSRPRFGRRSPSGVQCHGGAGETSRQRYAGRRDGSRPGVARRPSTRPRPSRATLAPRFRCRRSIDGHMAHRASRPHAAIGYCRRRSGLVAARQAIVERWPPAADFPVDAVAEQRARGSARPSAINGTTYNINRVWFEDSYGNVTRVKLSNIKLNQQLKDEIFLFTPPAGVEVYPLP